MKEEAGNNTPTIELSHYKERLLAATGISDSTYRSIVKEVGDIDAGGVTSFSSPGKKRSRPSPKSTLRTEEKQTIRTIVHNFYIHERRRPTIRGIYDKILENGIPFEEWASVCNHVDKVVADYLEKEHLLDNITEELEFVVNTGESDTDEDLYDDDDSEDHANNSLL
ncbi:hypothetical protein MML48_2g00016091 [Holotrichia oblita]|uniref:Uncharacterized protein n=1 Tax=Holotrichia oblita TaxID=644536 RepID=A0ACB9TJP5_HOLOL|nr:hypothetical protein MML48_2g00016091 [Holotrichia oblita]